jgi:hypothetical protein
MCPGVALQDQLFSEFCEICRLLRPCGVSAGQDSLASDELRELHIDDTYMPVDPEGLPQRLEKAGFDAVAVDRNEYAVCFTGRKAAP